MARKQVERNRSDPGMFIVTYTAEHNHPRPTHRNSLAGSTRQKLAETPSSEEHSKASYSPDTSSVASHSPPLEKLDGGREYLPEVEEDDDGFCVTNMTLDEDLFASLEDFTCPDAGEYMPGCLPANVQFPWISSSAATAAGGG
jgi:WRKY transcription factor 22